MCTYLERGEWKVPMDVYSYIRRCAIRVAGNQQCMAVCIQQHCSREQQGAAGSSTAWKQIQLHLRRQYVGAAPASAGSCGLRRAAAGRGLRGCTRLSCGARLSTGVSPILCALQMPIQQLYGCYSPLFRGRRVVHFESAGEMKRYKYWQSGGTDNPHPSLHPHLPRPPQLYI